MSMDPPSPPDDELDDVDDDDASLDFLRDIARVDDRAPPSRTDHLRLEGTNIGRFKVVSEIGRGGMGIVLLAEDEALRRKVALKLLPPSFAADEERRRRFLREARAAAAVSHANLVTVYDVGEHEGRAYIAMEYLRGKSLRERLALHALSVDESLELAKQILAGLAHAHAAGLLHRDLKPENVLVDHEGRVKLVDFGLAKLDGDQDGRGEASVANSTRDGLVMGTPGYMSPEQARGQDVDARSDIFSFGVLLYEMLTRKRPFAGPTRADILSALLRDEAPRVSALRPEVCNSLADVVARCLAKAPESRYPSVIALQEALDEAWTISKSGIERATTTGPTEMKTESAPPPRSNRWKWIVRGGALAAAAGVAIVVFHTHLQNAISPPAPSAAAAESDAGATKGLAITDLPLPKSNSPTALALYRQGIQAIRDADWGIAEERMRAAVHEDPELAQAYLHLAFMSGGTETGGPLQAREDLSRAMANRGSLTARDQELLMALEALITRPPSERSVALDRFQRLTEKYPNDAELWHIRAVHGSESVAASTEAERKAVALDPQFADAWQILGKDLAHDGNIDEGLAAIDKCVAISPLSADCRAERARVYGVLGDCGRMEEDIRRTIEMNPRAASIWQNERAAALLSTGRSDETVLEALKQKWAQIPADRRVGIEQYDRALLAAARGRFAEVGAALDVGEKAIEQDQSLYTHTLYMWLRAASELELGHKKEAGKLAQSYLARHDLWVRSHEMGDPEIPALRIALMGGAITRTAFERRRDEWWSQSPKAPDDWATAWAHAMDTPEDAKEALAVYNGLPEKMPVECTKIAEEALDQAALGRVYLMTGQAKMAVAPLEVVANQCSWMRHPIPMTHALLDLGKAHEAVGNTENACEAYQRLIARWGGAKSSVSLDYAKAHAKSLGCGTEARRAPAPPSMAGPHIEQDRMASNTNPHDPDDDDDDETTPKPSAPPSPPAPPATPPPRPPLPPIPPVGLAAAAEPLRTRIRVGVIQGADRAKACADAKKLALGQAECSKPRSVEGNCECHDLPNAWLCTAVMAVTCN